MKKTEVLKRALTVYFICLLGVCSTIFSALYIDCCGIAFLEDNGALFRAIIAALILLITVLSIVFYSGDKRFLYKLFILTVALYFLLILSLYLFKISGLNDKINSVESLRDYISSFGASAVLLFISVQFLQVAVLPIPAVITTGAGVLLFGPLRASLYSFIGIFIGSIVAFYIGKLFGGKVAGWLVGKDELNKWLNKVKGKDKVVLTIMFLFPFFPDDILCFIAGITSMSSLYFTVMIFITRAISVLSTCFSLSNNFIPYTTWWGILLWAVLILAAVTVFVYAFKYSDKIESIFKSKHKINKSKIKEDYDRHKQ